MPFKAYDIDSDKIIISLAFKSKLELINSCKNIICPYCKSKMHCRQRLNSVLHFVHNSSSTNCISGGEGWIHLECKRLIYSELKSQIDKMPSSMKHRFDVDLEYRIEEVNRIVDVALLYDSALVEAHEVQLSPIGIPELEDRSRDYRSQGIAAYWYFGGKSNTNEVRQWSRRNFGEVRCFNFQSD